MQGPEGCLGKIRGWPGRFRRKIIRGQKWATAMGLVAHGLEDIQA
jgi:hypothetical protein